MDVARKGFIDSTDWESIKRGGEDSIKRWIDNQLLGTSVTVVLIGKQTSERDWVNYEIKKSYARGNGLLGIYIHNVKNVLGQICDRGTNPLEVMYIKNNYDYKTYLSQTYKTYDWVLNDGYNNLGRWVEEAARIAGK